MRIITMTKQELNHHLKNAQKTTYTYQTDAGLLSVHATEMGIYKVKFVEPEKEFVNKSRTDIDALILAGTPFQIQVWKAALAIPAGKTASYKEIAHIINRPKSYRAVANALKHNPIGYFVPCHRVIKNSGDLCGYNGGIEKKRALLAAELTDQPR